MTHQSGLTRADAAMPIGPGREAEVVVVRAGLMALVIVLVATALIVTARRILGALVAPLPSSILAATGVALAVLAVAARSVSNRLSQQGGAGEWWRPIRIVTSLAVLAAAFSLSVPGSGWVGLTGLWIAVLTGEAISWRTVRMPRAVRPWRLLRLPIALRRVGSSARIDPPHAPASPVAIAEPSYPSEGLANEIVQQLTRRQLADGVEELSGWLRVSFAPGQRTENVHVAFCPPFPAPPQLAVSQLDGPTARMKTAQLLPYGARIDLKLSGPADTSTNVLLEFSARTGGS